jgi:excinuclease ABC subunit A
LASFLAESVKAEAGCLFLFDEPTTGLHATDVTQLIKTLRELIDRGNSGSRDRAQHPAHRGPD